MTTPIRTVEQTQQLLDSIGDLPMPTGLQPVMLPHEALRHLGMTDGLEIDDVVFDKNTSTFKKHCRILTVKERLDALKASAAFYAAQLKSIEGTIKGDVSSLSLEQLKAKALELLQLQTQTK